MKHLLLVLIFIMCGSFAYAQSSIICPAQEVKIFSGKEQLMNSQQAGFTLKLFVDYVIASEPDKEDLKYTRTDSGNKDVAWMLKNECTFKVTTAPAYVEIKITPTTDGKYTVHSDIGISPDMKETLSYDTFNCTVSK